MKTNAFCYACDTEFKVTSENTDPVKFCPLCGADINPDDDDMEEEPLDIEFDSD